jgi:hypothetical protein
MRTVGLMLGLVSLAAPAWADDVYRWTDESGSVHYSNTSGAEGATREALPTPPRPAAPAAPADDAAADGEAPPADDAYSASVSLKRNAMERDVRNSERRIRVIDGQLVALQRVRKLQAGDTAATGGVQPNLDFRSDEEKALATEREQLAQHIAEVKNDAATLRQEVTARSGGTTPSWWIDVK